MARLDLPAVRFAASIALLGTLLTSGLAGAQEPATDANGIRRSTIPVGSAWPEAHPFQLAISDDGQYVVYGANRGDGFRQYVHRIGERNGQLIPGLSAGAYFGQFSPNGEWLLFGQKMWIYKIPTAGGVMTKLYPANNWETWNTNDTFLITRGANGLSRVVADGSYDREDFPIDETTGVTGYQRPSRLPDGKGALVSVGYGTGRENRHIGIVSLPDGNLTIVPEAGAINPRYSASGHILYTVGNTLKAIPFDLDRLEVTGASATIVEGVHVYSNNASQFDISANGVLVYVPGSNDLGRTWPKRIVWVDRSGGEQSFHSAEKNFLTIKLSPNRRHLAAEVGTALDVFDTVTGVWTRVVDPGTGNGSPVWAADSESLFYTRGDVFGRMSVDGSGWTELLPGDRDRSFWGFWLSGDETEVLGVTYERGGAATWQLSRASVESGEMSRPLLDADTPTRRNPTLSEDGNWLAYVEKVDGFDHVYVEAYPSGGNRVMVSHPDEDAAEPVWGRGLELFYRDAANLVAVTLDASDTLQVADVTPMFSTRPHAPMLNAFAATYDHDPRTDRFLVVKWAIPDPAGVDIEVIENGFELLNRRRPGTGSARRGVRKAAVAGSIPTAPAAFNGSGHGGASSSLPQKSTPISACIASNRRFPTMLGNQSSLMWIM